MLRTRLSDEDLQCLIASYSATKDVVLRDKIVLQFQNLVESIGRRFAGSGEPLEDLAQEGYIGLITAADLYDAAKGVKFSTYATHFIIGQIKHALRDRGKIIKEPAWLQELNHRLSKVIESLSQELGRHPTETEIAKVMHVSEETIAELLTTREVFKVSSLDGDSDDQNQGNDLENIKDDRYTLFQLPVEDKIVLETAVNKLKIVEQKVIQDFYYTGLTQTEIAKRLGISCNYVSHILRTGTKKLRRILTTEELMEIQMQLQLANRRTDVMDSNSDASVVDPLTGLYNKTYVEIRLEEELLRARRDNSEVAYMLIKVKGLEDIADRYGTMHRDDLLCVLGSTIKENVRRCDIVGRFGEWDFSLILPYTGEQAQVVSDRIAGALQKLERDFLRKFNGVYFEPWIGFSVYPVRAGSVSDLISGATESAVRVELKPLEASAENKQRKKAAA